MERYEDKYALLARQNKSGNTVLHWAAMSGNKDVLCALFQKDPADIAAGGVEETEDEKFIPFGAIFNVKNNAGRTALDEAQMLGKDEVAGLLLKFSTLS